MAQTSVIQGAKAAAAKSVRTDQQAIARIRIVTIVGILAVWEFLAYLGSVGALYNDVVPSSWKIVAAVYAEFTEASFYHDLGVTLIEVVFGFLIGSAIAIFVGIAMGTRPLLRKSLEPYLNAIGSTPKIIFLPILFLIFGTGIESKIAKGALSAFFPVVFSTSLGMLLINPVLIRVGKSFNLSKWKMVTKIYVPAMINPVITGLRLGLAISVVGVLVAELKFADAGLGFRLGNYYDRFEIAHMYAIIIIIFGLAAAANVGVSWIQKRVNRRMAPTAKKGKAEASAAGGLGVAASN